MGGFSITFFKIDRLMTRVFMSAMFLALTE